MPIRRKRISKRKPRVRKVRKQNAARIMKCPTSFPDRLRVKLSFGNNTLVVMSAGATSNVYRIVAGYRPFDSGWVSSINPQGWDQYANMYNYYRPMGMKVHNTFSLIGAPTGQQSAICRGYWANYLTPLANDLIVLQNRFTKNKRVTQQQPITSWVSYSNLRNVTGQTKTQWMTDVSTYASVIALTGSQVSYYIHVVAPSGSAANTGQLETSGDLYVEFFGPRVLVDA